MRGQGQGRCDQHLFSSRQQYNSPWPLTNQFRQPERFHVVWKKSRAGSPAWS